MYFLIAMVTLICHCEQSEAISQLGNGKKNLTTSSRFSLPECAIASSQALRVCYYICQMSLKFWFLGVYPSLGRKIRIQVLMIIVISTGSNGFDQELPGVSLSLWGSFSRQGVQCSLPASVAGFRRYYKSFHFFTSFSYFYATRTRIWSSVIGGSEDPRYVPASVIRNPTSVIRSSVTYLPYILLLHR